MYIRSVTCFVNVDDAAGAIAGQVREAGLLAADARQALEAAGYPVQTARLATQPLSHLPDDPLPMAHALWPLCLEAGFEYLSLGPILADEPEADLARLDQIPELIRSTDAVFAGVLVGRAGGGLHFEAIRRTASVVRDIAHSTELGFGNLRLAMLANVGPHAPFFPAAYHDGGGPAVAIAVETASLAVEAITGVGSIDEARARLVAAVEAAGQAIAGAVAPLAEDWGFRFPGID
ncbi:MAG: DUF711 family protein, partial [Anaerolineae bacterium]